MPDPYVAQLGRISGALLNANLLRNGEDLTFRNGPVDDDLLYIDVINGRIGVNQNPPSYDLDVNGFGKFTGDIKVVGTKATIDNIVINTNSSFSTTVGPIIIAPTGVDAYVQYDKVLNPDLELKNNYIKTITPNQNLELNASGTGKVYAVSSAAVTGDLGVTGNITSYVDVSLNGQFIVGDSPLDTVTITPDFTQSVIPGNNSLYDFGSPSRRWNEVFLMAVPGISTVDTGSLVISNQTLYNGHTISTIQSNDDLILSPSSGTTILENISINQGVITNLLNSNIVLNHTDIGYLKINDTNAMRIPVGNNSERPGVEIGETRWNNEQGYLECFDGTVWQIATGGGVVVTPAFMEELGNVYTLIFG